MLLQLLLASLFIVGVSANYAVVSFQLRSTFDLGLVGNDTAYSERVTVSYQLNGETRYSTLDTFILDNTRYTNVRIEATGGKAIRKIKLTTFNTGYVAGLAPGSNDRNVFLNDNNFLVDNVPINHFGGILNHVVPAITNSYPYELAWGSMYEDGEHILNLAQVTTFGLTTKVNSTTSAFTSCTDTTKKYVCFYLKSEQGPGTEQEKVNVQIIRAGTVDTYLTFYTPPNDAYALIAIDTSKTPSGTSASATMTSLRINYLNDWIWENPKVDRNIYFDTSRLYIFGKLIPENDVAITRVGSYEIGPEDQDTVSMGHFEWVGNYTITNMPNPCTVSTVSFPGYSDILCLRLKSGSTTQNAAIVVSYATTANPSTLISQSYTLKTLYRNIMIGLVTSSISLLQISIDAGSSHATLDANNLILNGAPLSLETNACFPSGSVPIQNQFNITMSD